LGSPIRAKIETIEDKNTKRERERERERERYP